MTRAVSKMVAVLLLFGCCCSAPAEEPLFPFVISYDSPANVTNVSTWFAAPAGKDGFVRVHDGHLATNAGPIRFWGTNICFDGCFPSQSQAKRVAARLARLGINCVRLHHMDSQAIWGTSRNKLTIDPAQLERLDYFIYQLKLHGVYVNINLHVSRWFDEPEGFSGFSERPLFDKGLDQFEPRMIELQKKYARDLLKHVNPYTKTAYADEPAVAFVEISNEDGLLATWNWGKLDTLPEPYMTLFRELWNAWLRKKYGSTENLQKAWGNGSTFTLGEEMLRNGDFVKPLDVGWNVERDGQTKLDVSVGSSGDNAAGRALHLAVAEPGRESWIPQLTQSGFAVEKGRTYTLTFRMRANAPRQCHIGCQMSHAPWKMLGMWKDIKIGPQWRKFHIVFVADQTDERARIAFSHFEKGTKYDLADVSLRPGGIVGLGPNDRIEDNGVATMYSSAGVSPATSDFCDFLCDTELTYWREMRRFVKDELGVRSLVCGTQAGYGAIHAQAEFDFVDNHAYWQHPAFPHRDWDIKDWYIEDIALVNSPGDTLAHLAMARVSGKPYTVSEYNHPAPNSYAAECFTMAASFGAFQNWDAIYSFAYSHGRGFEPQHIESFFDMKSRTDQLAHMPACVAMFVRGDVIPSTSPKAIPFSGDTERALFHEQRNPWALTARELLDDVQYPLLHGTSLDVTSSAKGVAFDDGRKALAAGRFVSDTGQICWDIGRKDAGYYTVDSPRSKLFTGFTDGRDFSLGNVGLKIGQTRLGWATVSMTVVDGQGFDKPGRILVAATGLVQNQDAKLEHLEGRRVTLRDRWGNAPVLCEGIAGSITLPPSPHAVKCYPLDERGNRREAIPVARHDGRSQIELSPKHKTVWYELVLEP